MTIFFYSPKAYRYIRTVFQNRLPGPSTIRSWYATTDGLPGITYQALNILKRKATEAGEEKIYCCLSMDEMSIRHQVEWNDTQKRFVGLVDYGSIIPQPVKPPKANKPSKENIPLRNGIPNKKNILNNKNISNQKLPKKKIAPKKHIPVAKNALVYLVTGINQRWKIPVAYLLVGGLTAKDMAEITNRVLRFVAETGVDIIALTFDGLPANISMATELGAPINERPTFPHPSKDYDVLIFLDAAHMLKLIRNSVAQHNLYDDKGEVISFKYFKYLVELQERGQFHLANKLNRMHINWHQNKMNVKLAAQTLSESCAKALYQLSKDGKNPQFLGCKPTARLCQMVNDSFDCLNSRNLLSYGFQKPFNNNSAPEILSLIKRAEEYFSKLSIGVTLAGEFTKIPVLQSKSKTGFLGLIIDLQNLRRMYEMYVQPGLLKYILSYKLSQDHLEILFSCLRSRGGFNNNPNASQFAAAYKRLLAHNEVKSSMGANCVPLDDTSILNVSSDKKKAWKENSLILEQVPNDLIEVDDIPLIYIEENLNHTVEYLTGFIQRKLYGKIDCQRCIELIKECQDHQSEFVTLKSHGGLQQPKADLFSIAEITEKIWHVFSSKNELHHLDAYDNILRNVIHNVQFKEILKNFNDHGDHVDMEKSHKFVVISLFTQFYLKSKFNYVGKCLTRSIHEDSLIRHKCTKLVLFQGQ